MFVWWVVLEFFGLLSNPDGSPTTIYIRNHVTFRTKLIHTGTMISTLLRPYIYIYSPTHRDLHTTFIVYSISSSSRGEICVCVCLCVLSVIMSRGRGLRGGKWGVGQFRLCQRLGTSAFNQNYEVFDFIILIKRNCHTHSFGRR